MPVPYARRLNASITRKKKEANSVTMRKKLFDAVVHGKGPGSRRINQHLDSARSMKYPLPKLGNKSKVPRESYQAWGHVPAVREALGNPHISGKLIREALYQRSAKAYEAEWAAAERKAKLGAKVKEKTGTKEKMDQWDKDITRNINNANARNGQFVANEVKRRIGANSKAGRLTTLIDLGSGAGLTLLPVIKQLSPSQRKKVRVVGVDVGSKGFSNILHGDPIKKTPGLLELGVPKENIHLVNASFGNLLKDPVLKKMVGEADVVTSGAALHHMSKSETVFLEVQKLLKKGGSFKFWDWSHPAWRAPNLVVAPRGASVSVNGRAYKHNGKIVRAKGGIGFISQRPGSRKNLRSELAQTREMLSTWVSLLNFSAKEKQAFRQWFDRRVELGKPINFESYLKKLQGKRPSKKAEIEVMEAHKTWQNYSRAIRGSGMSFGRPVFSPDSGLLVHYSATKK